MIILIEMNLIVVIFISILDISIWFAENQNIGIYMFFTSQI